jgi:hypothetical protein
MNNFNLQINPFIIPTSDNKLIIEYFSKASIEAGNFGVAYVTAVS